MAFHHDPTAADAWLQPFRSGRGWRAWGPPRTAAFADASRCGPRSRVTTAAADGGAAAMGGHGSRGRPRPLVGHGHGRQLAFMAVVGDQGCRGRPSR